MRKTGILVITALFAAMMAACGGTAENKPANVANTNTNTVADQGPTVAMLKELETKAFEAYKNKDTKYFDTFLASNFVGFNKGEKHDRAAVLKMIGEHKDDIKGFTFSEERITKISPTAAVLTAKVVTDGTMDGKKAPDAISSTLYVKEGTAWKAAGTFGCGVHVLSLPPHSRSVNWSGLQPCLENRWCLRAWRSTRPALRQF